MFKNSQNLSKSVMPDLMPKIEWANEVYLADQCKERFLTTSEIPEMNNYQFYMAGLAELSHGYRVERQGINIHTILFTLEGRGLLTTVDQVIEIEPHTVTVLPANLPYRFELHPDDNQWKMLWMLLNPVKKWSGIEAIGQKVMPSRSCEQLWSLFNLLHIEINGRPHFRKLIMSEVTSVLTGIENKPVNSELRVQTLINDIKSQLHLPWSVTHMAERCFISEEQLNRIFKNLYGLSPKKKLIELRMDKAKYLLRSELWNISMIAPQVGYKDPYGFTHRFTKHFGLSPRDYRKRNL